MARGGVVTGTTNAILARLCERGLADEVKAIAARHHVSVDDILGPEREASICEARRELVQFLYVDCGKSMPGIAKLLGRNNKSILYALLKRHVERRNVHVAAAAARRWRAA